MDGGGAEIERPRSLDKTCVRLGPVLSLPLTDGCAERKHAPHNHNDKALIMMGVGGGSGGGGEINVKCACIFVVYPSERT